MTKTLAIGSIYRVEYDLGGAGRDESTVEASSGPQHLSDHSALPALAGLAHDLCRNCTITYMGHIQTEIYRFSLTCHK